MSKDKELKGVALNTSSIFRRSKKCQHCGNYIDNNTYNSVNLNFNLNKLESYSAQIKRKNKQFSRLNEEEEINLLDYYFDNKDHAQLLVDIGKVNLNIKSIDISYMKNFMGRHNIEHIINLRMFCNTCSYQCNSVQVRKESFIEVFNRKLKK